jgi:hypothetical protein
MANEIRIDDMATKVAESLKTSGIEMSDSVVKLIIEGYVTQKREQFLMGNAVVEDGIGTQRPGYRRVSNAFNPRYPYTAKMITDIDYGLKDAIIEKLSTDGEFRVAVGATEL